MKQQPSDMSTADQCAVQIGNALSTWRWFGLQALIVGTWLGYFLAGHHEYGEGLGLYISIATYFFEIILLIANNQTTKLILQILKHIKLQGDFVAQQWKTRNESEPSAPVHTGPEC